MRQRPTNLTCTLSPAAGTGVSAVMPHRTSPALFSTYS